MNKTYSILLQAIFLFSSVHCQKQTSNNKLDATRYEKARALGFVKEPESVAAKEESELESLSVRLSRAKLFGFLKDPEFEPERTKKVEKALGREPERGTGQPIGTSGAALVNGYNAYRMISATSTSPISVYRYQTNPQLDTSFNTTGSNTVSILSKAVPNIREFTEINTSFMLLGGDTATNTTGQNNFDFFLVRLISNGLLDTSFGTKGVAYTSFGGGWDFMKSIARDSLNRYLVAGGTENSSNYYSIAIARVNPTDGTLDTTFNTNGQKVLNFSSGDDFANSIYSMSGGKILVGGRYQPRNSPPQYLALRMASDGTLDTTFMTTGVLNHGTGESRGLFSETGRYVHFGNEYTSSVAGGMRVYLYNTDGSANTTFGAGNEYRYMVTEVQKGKTGDGRYYMIAASDLSGASGATTEIDEFMTYTSGMTSGEGVFSRLATGQPGFNLSRIRVGSSDQVYVTYASSGTRPRLHPRATFANSGFDPYLVQSLGTVCHNMGPTGGPVYGGLIFYGLDTTTGASGNFTTGAGGSFSLETGSGCSGVGGANPSSYSMFSGSGNSCYVTGVPSGMTTGVTGRVYISYSGSGDMMGGPNSGSAATLYTTFFDVSVTYGYGTIATGGGNTTIDLGGVCPSSSGSNQYTIAAAGTCNTSGLSFTKTGADFSIDTGAFGSCGPELGFGGTCTFSGIFNPSSSGAKSGTLQWAAGTSVINYTLTGTGWGPGSIGASGSPIDCGSICVGSSGWGTGTVYNNDAHNCTTATVSGVSTSGAGFSYNGTCTGSSYVSGSGCMFSGIFNPSSAGAKSGVITFTAGTGTANFTLTGTGIARSTIVLSPATLNFGSVMVGSSGSGGFTGNGSGTACESSGSTNSISGSDFFVDWDMCNSGVTGSGGTCMGQLRFQPSSSGNKSGAFTISGTWGTSTMILTGAATRVARLGIPDSRAESVFFPIQAYWEKAEKVLPLLGRVKKFFTDHELSKLQDRDTKRK